MFRERSEKFWKCFVVFVIYEVIISDFNESNCSEIVGLEAKLQLIEERIKGNKVKTVGILTTVSSNLDGNKGGNYKMMHV